MVAPEKDNAVNATISAAPIVTAANVKFGKDLPISIIAGPCQLESRAHALEVAGALKEVTGGAGNGPVYKNSFGKGNPTHVSAPRGHRPQQAPALFGGIIAPLRFPLPSDHDQTHP